MFRFFRAPVWIVVPADAAAADLCAALHARSFRRGWSGNEFESMLADPSVAADLLVDRDDRRRTILGFALSRKALDEAELCSIAVAPEMRGKGGGAALLDRHLVRLANRGVRRLVLEVDEANGPARRLYGSFGFSEVGRRAGYYGSSGGGTALVLARQLGPPALMDAPDVLP